MTYQGLPPPRSVPTDGRDQTRSDYAGKTDPGYSAEYGGQPQPGYGGPAGSPYPGPGGPGYGEQPQPPYGPGGPVGPEYGGPAGPEYGGPAGPEYGGPARPEYGGPAGPEHDGTAGYGGTAAPSPRRAAISRLRYSRRTLWFWSAIGLAVAGAVVVVVALVEGGGRNAGAAPGALVTTFMRGEIQQVPNACAAVPTAVLDKYMPGRSKAAAAEPLEGKAGSQCSWTVDTPQRYRFMEVVLEAYAPSGLASGNGSATQAAEDAFAGARAAKQFPQRQSKQPKATVSDVTGLGQQAFSADQHYNRHALLDMETLVVRYRNVLVTVIFEARVGGRYGPDPGGALRTGAEAAAKAALGAIH